MLVLAVGMSASLALGGSTARPLSGVPCVPSRYRSAHTLIIAHAGGNYFGPANTIEMMRAAKAAGADILDADVRVTKDGVLVAAHDDAIATKSGNALSVADTNYADVRSVDLGDEWAGPAEDYPLAGTRVTVPTIESVLRTFPADRVGLEFKTDGAEAALCGLLRTLHRTDDVFVSSGGDGPVSLFTSICPEAITTITDAMEAQYLRAEATNSPWCASVGIGQPPLDAQDFRLTRENVRWDHEHGLADYAWTANSEESLRAVALLGVDAVYTDRPDLARVILKR